MTFSPGNVVRLKCGGPPMVVARDDHSGSLLCLWVVHTMVAREYFPDDVLERVKLATHDVAPADRETALNLWAEGASMDDIAALAGYANASVVKQIVFRARKAGDARATARRVGRKAAE